MRFTLPASFVLILTVAASSMNAGQSAPTQPQVTFTKDIAPIFQSKCEACHRPGSMAPMSLITYEEARPWARAIAQRVETRQMPPWHIDRTIGIQDIIAAWHGDFDVTLRDGTVLRLSRNYRDRVLSRKKT